MFDGIGRRSIDRVAPTGRNRALLVNGAGNDDPRPASSPVTDSGQGGELAGAETITKPGRLDAAFERQAECSAVAQVALLDTIQLTVIQQTLRPVKPCAATHQLALVQQNEGQPEGTTGGSGDIAGA